MEPKIELTYQDRQRLRTYSTDDYLWQYASNSEVQLQMLLWEREEAANPTAAESKAVEPNDLAGVTGAMVVEAAVEILGVPEASVA